MITILAKLFIRNANNLDDPETRRAYGSLCAIAAIALNIALSIVKFILAHLSGAFSIRADALNNLTDASGGLLVLVAFYFAGARPRPDRPFGHGRVEYVAGLIVSGLILSLGVELARDSIVRIVRPEPLVFSGAVVGALVASIALKFYMSYFISGVGKKIESEALIASGRESRSDTIATIAALVALLVYQFTPNQLNLDGWFGLLVSFLVLKAGVDSGWETLKQLLGAKPDPELVKKVCDICMSYDEVVGVHDMVVHDYGPGRLHISAHCEVPGDGDVFVLHDAMDRIMRELDEKLGCESVIHMDPICVDDERVATMRAELASAVKSWTPKATIHDFRMTEGPTHMNLIFDCVAPYDVEPDDDKAKEQVVALVKARWENAVPVVTIDRPYV